MRIKNLTVFPAAGTVTSTRPPAPEMSFVVRGLFRLVPGGVVSELPLLDQGKLSAETFAEDDDAREGGALTPSDFADLKPRVDLLLKGTCYTPNKKALSECPVRFQVGAFSKLLRVIGRRVWRNDALNRASEPAPFVKMPIDWTEAFGGKGYAANPSGKGFESLELPCVEDASAPILTPQDRPAPAGFGPVNPAWPSRKAKIGKEYGRSYAKRAPFYAEDFDWSYWNAAAPDQQIEALAGDEELVLQNLHPTEQVLVTRLPKLRVRAFVMDTSDVFREMKMRLDTLYVDADAGTVALTWRGLDQVKEDDLADVRTVLVAKEGLAEAPLPKAHYHELLLAFEKDPTGMRAALEKSAPELDAEAFLAGELGAKEAPAPPAEGDVVSKLFGKKLAFVPADIREAVKGNLEKLLASPSGAKIQKAIEDAASAPPEPPVSVIPIASPEAIAAAERAAIRPALPALALTKKQLASFPQLTDKQRKKLGEIETLEAKIPKPSTGVPGPGADLSWQDLSGQDLSGVDLTGALCEGTLFAGANLAGAKLNQARLKEAVFSGANLEGADLSGAVLRLTNFAGAKLDGAKLVAANLDWAYFDKASLKGATFDDAFGKEAIFTGADLSGASLARVRLTQARMTGIVFHRASFANASLTQCWLDRATGEGALFTSAELDRTSFWSSKLADGSFERARGERVIFLKADVSRADFSRANLETAFFDEAVGVAARFFGANLKGARFYRATLDGADFTRSNLFGADLRKAKLSDVKFRDASLFDAKLLGAAGKGADFRGANLNRAMLPTGDGAPRPRAPEAR